MYLVWDYTNLKSTNELIYKRASGKINNQHVTLANYFDSEASWKYDIIYVEDPIHEIYIASKDLKLWTTFSMVL